MRTVGEPARCSTVKVAAGGAAALGAYQKIRWNSSPSTRSSGATVDQAQVLSDSSVFNTTSVSWSMNRRDQHTSERMRARRSGAGGRKSHRRRRCDEAPASRAAG